MCDNRPMTTPIANPDYDRGMALLHAQSLTEALEALDAALVVEPGRARIHANRALALAHLDRVHDARLSVVTAKALDPEDPYVLVCDAHIARCDCRWDDALASSRAALSKAPPDKVRTWGRREEGWTLIELDRPREALEIADDLVETNPSDAESVSLQANALAACERWGEALRTMDGALALAPADTALQERREVFARAVDDLQIEVARAHGSTAMHPDDWEGWHALGVLLMKVGELAEAREAFDEARQVHPDEGFREGPELSLSLWEADCRAGR